MHWRSSRSNSIICLMGGKYTIGHGNICSIFNLNKTAIRRPVIQFTDYIMLNAIYDNIGSCNHNVSGMVFISALVVKIPPLIESLCLSIGYAIMDVTVS